MEMPVWKQQEDDRNLLVDFRRSFISNSRETLALNDGTIARWSNLPSDLETARLWDKNNRPMYYRPTGTWKGTRPYRSVMLDETHKVSFCPAHEQRWKASTPPTLDLKIAIANCEDCKAVRMGLPVELLSQQHNQVARLNYSDIQRLSAYTGNYSDTAHIPQ